jgi:uncharacterized repeat protein (TIGR03803 family)
VQLRIEELELRVTPSITTLASLADATNGAAPYSIIQDSSGNCFGTTESGGAFGYGTVFELPKGSSTITTLASFNLANGSDPRGVVEDSSGNLFGTTYAGGAYNDGAVFEVKKDSYTITTLCSFNGGNGANPASGVVLDGAGDLFGTTSKGVVGLLGTVFEVQAGSNTITTLASFNGNNGAQPLAPLTLDSHGNLFGTVSTGYGPLYGTVFELPSGSGTLTTLASFNGTNGSDPEGPLVVDSSGNLFGACKTYGTLFEVQLGSGTITTLATFNGSDGTYPGNLLEDASGNLFGTTAQGGAFNDGTVFELPHGSGTVTTLVAFNGINGVSPTSLIEDGSGNLFGTSGGISVGTVFEIPNGSTTLSTLAIFQGNTGKAPSGKLLEDSNGNLFGTTSTGGPSGHGTVFEIKAGSSVITLLAAFNGANGDSPNGSLVEDGSGNLFGTTSFGGAFNDGTVFEVGKNTGRVTTLATFSESNGLDPRGGLVEDSSGNLFGTTYGGGIGFYNGTLFEVPAGGGPLSTLAYFDNYNGRHPEGDLLRDASGNLFGITAEGGPAYDPYGSLYVAKGTVYELASGSNAITTLAAFDNQAAASGAASTPASGLVIDSSGNLFGTTVASYGNPGTVYEVQNGTNTVTVLADFNGINGSQPFYSQPTGGLLVDSSGDLFGTTTAGGMYSDSGTVFEVAHGSDFITTLVSFDGMNGRAPQGTLLEDGSGNFFGTTSAGGFSNSGVVFEVTALSLPTTTTLPGWTVNAPGYGKTLTATGGAAPFTFALTSGSLPSGLGLDSSGVLTGTPTATGSYHFVVTVTDSTGSAVSQSYALSINPAVTITTAVLANAPAGIAYSQAIVTSGGTGGLTFTETGPLPPGLLLTHAGVLIGAPTATGSYTFTITATDTLGISDTSTYTLAIFAISPSALPTWTANKPGYNLTLTATGGNAPYTYSESGALPPGVTLSSAGVLSGTPTEAGTFTFTVNGTDVSSTTVGQTYALVVIPALSFGDDQDLAPWQVNQPLYSGTLWTTGGTAPLTFSVGSGLPPGVTLTASGVLSGTPTAVGTFIFTVTVSDARGNNASRAFTLPVYPALTITTKSLASWTVNQGGYNQTIGASGGVWPSYTFSQVTGHIPVGLSLSGSGVLSGRPAIAGSYAFTVVVTDRRGETASQSCTIIINPSLTITTASLPTGTVFAAYNQAISTSGGTGTATFALSSGALPTGLTLSSAGVLSGTPTVAGTYGINVTATDSAGASSQADYFVVINPIVTISITTTALSDWTVNAAYNTAITATGGTGPLTFSTISGTLPPGLTLAAGTGVLSGTPISAGSFSFTIGVVDTVGGAGSKSFTVIINPAAVIVSTSLASWTVNRSGYFQAIITNGGTGPMTFALTSGTVPPGLTLSSGGVLSGTPSAAGTYTFAVTATDMVGVTSSPQNVTVVINMPVTFTTTALASWTVNQPGYNQTINATGGMPGYEFIKSGGALPTGLTLSIDGVLSGTPTLTGSFGFTVQATDGGGSSAKQTFTVNINPVPTITTATLAGWTVSQAGYSQTLLAGGGTGTITFAVRFGTLPAGMNLSSLGVLSGTPTVAGSFNLVLSATDSLGATGNKAYTLTINPPVTIDTTSLAAWTANTANFLQTITALGGTVPVGFTVTGGTIPAGLILGTTGVLSGTPTLAGTFNFTVTATDSAGSTDARDLSLTVNPAVMITTTALPAWTINQPGFSQTITAMGGTGSFTFALTAGTLPTGLVLSDAGLLTGTPTAAGSFTFTVTATDAVGATSTQSVTLAVNPPPMLSPLSLLGDTVNTAVNQPITAGGGTGLLTLTTSNITGLIPGLNVPANGTGTISISGTPTATGTLGLTVTVMDAIGASVSQDYLLIVNPALAITTTSLPDWTISTTYNQTLSRTGGTGSATYSVVLASLPAGLILSSAGVLSGIPTAAGNYSFTVTATDAVGATTSQSYSVTINPAVTVVVTTLPDWTLNISGYSQTVGATGGTGSFTYNQTAGTLPTGLVLSSTGGLSGTPTASGSYNFTVTATDLIGASGSETYTVNINPAPALSPGVLPVTTIGVAYNRSITASGGTGTVTLTTSGFSGVIPGLNVPASSTGPLNITGTPTATGTERFTVTATDTLGSSTSVNYSITVNPGTVFLNLPSSGFTGTSGGTVLNFPININELQDQRTPNHVGLASATLAITFPTGVFSFPLGTGNASAYVSLGSVPLSDTVAPGGAADWTLTATSPADGQLNITLTAKTGKNITANNPATGGSLVTINFPVSSTYNPTAATSQAITVVNANGTFHTSIIGNNGTYTLNPVPPYSGSITIGPPFSITTTSLPAASAGTAFMQTFSTGGGTGSITFSETGSLPAGMTLSTSGVLSGTPTVAGDYTITVSAMDALAESASHNYDLIVAPGSLGEYLVSVAGSSTVQAGNSFMVAVQAADAFGNTITSYSGPSTASVMVSPSNPANVFPSIVSLNGSGLGLFLATLPKVGSYTIDVSSVPIAGSTGPLNVLAGTQIKLEFGTQPVSTPIGVVLPAVTVQVEDAYGNLVTSENGDLVTLGVASGPGPFAPESTTSTTVRNGVATFGNLILASPGTYQLSALVPTRFTGPNSASFSITPLQVVPASFSGSSSGFSLQFNAPYLVDSLTPVLYGAGFGVSAPVPSVTLTQTQDGSGNAVNKPVEGSLLLDPASNRIAFVATNTAYEANNGAPVLPDGSYSAVVHGSAATNGFQALLAGGGFLDGLGTGTAGSGDFVASFTVHTAGQDIVWIPATANGPGQPLAAPGMNQAGGGYPVYLDDSTGTVTYVQVTLSYNPSLLSVTGVAGVGLTLLGTSTPGQAVLSYTGPALSAGSQTLIGYLLATVPGGSAAKPTPYKAKDLLHLTGVALNGGTILVTTSDALHLVAYVGDANGDGAYSSDDAVKVTRAALQLDSGIAAYPLVDPVIVADTDGAGYVPPDAALQVNEAGVNFPTANLPSPPLPAGVVFQPIGNNVDPTLGLELRDQSSEQSKGGIVTAAVNLDDADPAGSTGLLRGHLALSYDPRQFTVSASDVHLGSLLAGGGWSVTPTIDPATGQIGIALSSDTPIQSAIGGSLVTIDFHPIADEPGALATGRVSTPVAYAPGSSIALVASATPNGQYVATELEDAQGTFTLSPAPSNDTGMDLAATPLFAVSVPVLATEVPVVATATPVSFAGAEARVSENPTGEALPIVDDAEQGPPSIAAPAHGDLVMRDGLPAVFSWTVSPPAPLPGTVFPGLSAVAGAPGWQRLTDQFFQTLGRTAASFAEQPLLSRDSSQALPSLPSWSGAEESVDETAAFLESPPEWPLRIDHPARQPRTLEVPSTPRPPSEVLDRAAVDQAFVPTAAEVDPSCP